MPQFCHLILINKLFFLKKDNGDLYMWGRNRDGCLGLNHKQNQFFPLRVSNDKIC